MTPQDQVQEIIKILAPEAPNQTDAVFLVTQYVQQMEARLSALSKQNQKLGAELEEKNKKIHLLVNEKLKLINGEPREVTEVNGEVEETSREAGVPKGQTL